MADQAPSKNNKVESSKIRVYENEEIHETKPHIYTERKEKPLSSHHFNAKYLRVLTNIDAQSKQRLKLNIESIKKVNQKKSTAQNSPTSATPHSPYTRRSSGQVSGQRYSTLTTPHSSGAVLLSHFQTIRDEYIGEFPKLMKFGKIPMGLINVLEESFKLATYDTLHRHLTKRGFVAIIQKSLGCMSAHIPTRVFALMDMRGNHVVTQDSFVRVVSMILKGAFPLQQFIGFQIYDLDGDGVISASDLFKHIRFGTCSNRDFVVDFEKILMLFQHLTGSLPQATMTNTDGIHYEEFVKCIKSLTYPSAFEKIIVDKRKDYADSGQNNEKSQ